VHDKDRLLEHRAGPSGLATLVEEGIDLGLLQEAQAAPQHIGSVSGFRSPPATGHASGAAQSLAVGPTMILLFPHFHLT